MLSLSAVVSCDRCTQCSTYIMLDNLIDELRKQGWKINEETGDIRCAICQWEKNHKIMPPTRKIRADMKDVFAMPYKKRLEYSKQTIKAVKDISLKLKGFD